MTLRGGEAVESKNLPFEGKGKKTDQSITTEYDFWAGVEAGLFICVDLTLQVTPTEKIWGALHTTEF